MKRKFLWLVIFLLSTVFCFLSSDFTYAAVPHLINYQGRLTDTSSKPLEGSYAITFKIYDAETAGTLLWEETQSGVVIQKGIFSVLLGSVTSLNIAFDKQYYLEIKVGSEVMSPRQRITSAGYAIRAEKAETATSADNATTVAGVGVSTTPAANKILPLDGSAKIPQSVIGLKVYDSGWFGVTTNTNYVKTHNLGTTKCLVLVYTAQNSDGSGWCVHNMSPASYYAQRQAMMVGLSTTQIKIRTVECLADFIDENGQKLTPLLGYSRIIILALE